MVTIQGVADQRAGDQEGRSLDSESGREPSGRGMGCLLQIAVALIVLALFGLALWRLLMLDIERRSP